MILCCTLNADCAIIMWFFLFNDKGKSEKCLENGNPLWCCLRIFVLDGLIAGVINENEEKEDVYEDEYWISLQQSFVDEG